MKINEIPEKIYLSYETDNEDDKDHIFIDYMWHRHPFEGRNLENIEYTRTDAFIEKAAKWINEHTSLSEKLVIENFRKFMKGE